MLDKGVLINEKDFIMHYQDSEFQFIINSIGLFSVLVLNFMALDRIKNDVYGWDWYLCSHRTWLVVVGAIIFTLVENKLFKLQDRGFWIHVALIVITIYIFYICYHNQFGMWIYNTKKIAEIAGTLAFFFYAIKFGLGDFSGPVSNDISGESDINNEGVAGKYYSDDGTKYKIYGEPGNYYYYDKNGGHHIYPGDPNADIW